MVKWREREREKRKNLRKKAEIGRQEGGKR